MTRKCIGLTFHGIGTPRRDLDPGEAPYWIGLERFEEILEMVCRSPDRDHIRLTFDDGNLSDFEIALPRLAARGLQAEFFVISGRIGVPGSLAADQLRALAEAGMRIGSHGINHVDWARLSQRELEDELVRSRHDIAQAVSREVNTAAIPFGRYNARVLRALRRTGYAYAYSSDGGTMAESGFLKPRVSFTCDMTVDQVLSAVRGTPGTLSRLRRAVSMMQKRLFPLS